MDGTYRSQMRAMVAALNAHQDLTVTVPEIKQSFYYYGGKHNFAKFFDVALDKFSGHVKVIYHRVPGSYTEVYVHVQKQIISNI